jgi:hypothetical protein
MHLFVIARLHPLDLAPNFLLAVTNMRLRGLYDILWCATPKVHRKVHLHETARGPVSTNRILRDTAILRSEILFAGVVLLIFGDFSTNCCDEPHP